MESVYQGGGRRLLEVATAFSAPHPRARGAYRIVLVDQLTLLVDSMQRALSIKGYDARWVSHAKVTQSPEALLSEVRAMDPRLVLVELDLGPGGRSPGRHSIGPRTGSAPPADSPRERGARRADALPQRG